jgi:hypothetical protein
MRVKYVLDCADPDKLADFWAAALGLERSGSGAPYVSLREPGPGRSELLLQRVPEPKHGNNRMHPDLRVTDAQPRWHGWPAWARGYCAAPSTTRVT